jgi:holo-[acyl-carrier protein] synthase
VILGLGIDVCSVARIEGVLERWGEAFWNRILNEHERELLASRSDRATALAGRFAAKEAAAKAMDGGRGVGWHHLEVRGQPKRPPKLVLRGPAKALADKAGVESVYLSITHDAGVAAAVVVMEGSKRGEPWP